MFALIFSIVFISVVILPETVDKSIIVEESFVEMIVFEVDSADLAPIIQESNPYYHIYSHSIYHNIYQPGAFHFKLPLKTDKLKIEVKWERYTGADNITFPSGYVFDLESRIWVDFGYGSGEGIIMKMKKIEINGVREGHRVFEIDMNEHPVYGMKIDPGFYYLGVYSLSTEFTIKVTALVPEA